MVKLDFDTIEDLEKIVFHGNVLTLIDHFSDGSATPRQWGLLYDLSLEDAATLMVLAQTVEHAPVKIQIKFEKRKIKRTMRSEAV
jgi:hypothetical protein